MEDSSDNRTEAVGHFITIGTEIVGSMTGAAVSLFADGPAGVLAGGAVGPLVTHAFRKVASEIQQRFLGPREEIRIGATFTFAAARVQRNLLEGKNLRRDTFFQDDINDRSAADEIVEGTLLAAQREHEEQKLQFYGNLLANIAFHPEINRAQANQLITQAERMSYHQFCLLAFYVQQEKLRTERIGRMYPEFPEFNEASIVQETYELFQQGIFHRSQNMAPEAIIRSGNLHIDISELGLKLYELMELHEIEPQELKLLSQFLWAE